jgi:hypothetical protein
MTTVVSFINYKGGVDADRDDFLEHNEQPRETLPA